MDKQGFEKLKNNLIDHHINCVSNDENVWVDSLYRSSEFRGLLEAITKGDLVWKGDK